jgi:hypothetical protein
MNKVGIGKVGIGILAALIAISTASAHMGWGYSYGGMGGYSYGGYGMPMMGMPGWYSSPTTGTIEVTVEGNVSAIYPMFVQLDSGERISIPWWFVQQAGIVVGDEINVTGFEYGAIIPTKIEVNGEEIGMDIQQYGGQGYGMMDGPMYGYTGYAPYNYYQPADQNGDYNNAYPQPYGGWHCPMWY